MAADFNKPTIEDQYVGVLAQVRANLDVVITQNYAGSSNIPQGARRFNDATNRWEKLAGGAWAVFSNLYEIHVRSAIRLLDVANNVFWEVSDLRNATNINAGTLDEARVGILPASKTTSGTFDTARIPGLDASKIIGGKLLAALLPNHTADLLTSGQVNFQRLPVATDTQRGAVVVDREITADGTNPVMGRAIHAAVGAISLAGNFIGL